MTRAKPSRVCTIPELRRRCHEIRALVRAPHAPLASEEEVRAAWPGGEDNRSRGLDGWIECYAQLAALNARQEHRDRSKADASKDLESVVSAASAREALPVLLSIGSRAVYPKSAWTLAILDSLDRGAQATATAVAQAREELGDDASATAMWAFVARGLAWRTWAWVLLTPGVGLPFEEEGDIDPPAWTTELLAEDYLAIFAAHRALHLDAIAIMAAALPSDGGPAKSRLSLTGFLTGYASEKGISPSHLMRRWSLPESVAAAVAAAEAHRVAEINSKARQGAKTR